MKQRIICAKCSRELPERQTNSGVDVLYVDEKECRHCQRRNGTRRIGVTKLVRVGGYDPESKKKVVDPTLKVKP